jgi:hypothetical protein
VTLPGIDAAGHGAAQAIFPLIAAAVALWFGAVLAARYAARRRPHELAWSVALLMFAAASAAAFLGVVRGWTPTDFRVYWLFGAILNVPYLVVGEAYLLARRRAVGHLVLLVVMVVSVYAGVEVWRAAVSVTALNEALPLGKDIFGSTSSAYRLAQLVAFPAYFLLLGGLVWSAWQARNRRELRGVMNGTLLIALGATVIAIGSGVGAGFHVVWLFFLSLAAGIVVMYGGFLAATRPVRAPPAEA